MSKFFDQALNKVKPEVKRFVDNSLEIADQIHAILESKNKSQKDLADLLGKSESEVSKWLTGTHNMTLKTISKIEIVLDEKIITTPIQSRIDFFKRTENAIKILATQNCFYTSVEETKYNPIWAQFFSNSKATKVEQELPKQLQNTVGENNYGMAA